MELWLVLGISVVAITFAFFLIQNVMQRSTGTADMQRTSDAIKKGAEAFLAHQNKTIGTLAIAASARTFCTLRIFA